VQADEGVDQQLADLLPAERGLLAVGEGAFVLGYAKSAA